MTSQVYIVMHVMSGEDKDKEGGGIPVHTAQGSGKPREWPPRDCLVSPG